MAAAAAVMVGSLERQRQQYGSRPRVVIVPSPLLTLVEIVVAAVTVVEQIPVVAMAVEMSVVVVVAAKKPGFVPTS